MEENEENEKIYPRKTLRDVSNLVAASGFVEAGRLNTMSSQAMLEPITTKRLKKESLEILIKKDNELYLSMSPYELTKRYILIDWSKMPEEFRETDEFGEPSNISKAFYTFFHYGGERGKPSNMFKYLVSHINWRDRKEWTNRNKRRIFEVIYKALRQDMPDDSFFSPGFLKHLAFMEHHDNIEKQKRENETEEQKALRELREQEYEMRKQESNMRQQESNQKYMEKFENVRMEEQEEDQRRIEQLIREEQLRAQEAKKNSKGFFDGWGWGWGRGGKKSKKSRRGKKSRRSNKSRRSKK